MVLQNSGKVKKSRFENQQEVSAKRLEDAKLQEELDEKYGYEKLNLPCEKLGWLINLSPADVLNENKRLVSAIDLYFLQEDGKRFKISMPYQPYFYVAVTKNNEREMTTYLQKKFLKIHKIEILKKEDLDLHNHLVGIQRTYIKLSFFHVDDMSSVRQAINQAVKKNKEKNKSEFSSMCSNAFESDNATYNEPSLKLSGMQDQMECLVDIREYDVPYHVRVSIDLKIFVGLWYTVLYKGSGILPSIIQRDDILVRPDPVVLAYDIETTKLPLKFPDSETDNIIMISYMIDGTGYLICNREIVSADVENFEFTPRPEFMGKFEIFNEPDEVSTINRFFDHILDVKPHIFVTYNGDFFDWPFVEARALKHGINMMHMIGFSKDSQGEYKSRQASHMDAFRWVKRDSYLPVGSQNLKAAAKAKLQYDPVELDPEELCRLASEEPQILANYSVSDAVATYYLYMKYVHPFIFALCTIIPMEPDSVLRKGSGTLCEALLMVQAFHANIIYPNKQETVYNKMTSDGHILDSETYVGGHVEALECGVFRSNIHCNFRGDPEMYLKLHDDVERTIKFCIEVEEKIPMHEVLNFDEVCNDIKEKLKSLHDKPVRYEYPFIYHLDVGAMYPNIILTNRLQPSAIVNEITCAACDFNKPGATCQRSMSWMWRGEYMPASRSEYYRIQQQLENDRFPNPLIPNEYLSFHKLSKEEQANQEKKRLQEYCRRAYKKIKIKRLEEKYTTVCQRENSFYVDTVRMFRDRRYEFKAALKRAKKQVIEATAKNDATEIKKASGLEVFYDSLQLAHKCILNSFYGYVMRKGARWYSMEMAGIVCYTGAKIIQDARKIVDKIGRPLELDTDGIWCVLPSSFPENYTILTKNSKKPKIVVSYPGAMLNIMVKDNFTNDQYEELVDPENLTYKLRSENSIFFEVDGPYLAMVLPAAKEEGKSLKKRYAVFNMDESLAELKGFEIKRRGELQLIKIFQSSVFEAFLKGKNLQEVYESVAKVADYWLDVLYSKAGNMPDSELFQLISENRSMSKKLEDYGSLKSTSISTAKRLAEFLGDQMVKDAGLACRFIISQKPDGAPVTERAIPLAIFKSESSIKRHYLRKWTRQSNMTNFDIRAILDWNYYIERLGSAIQKIITIPAALQGIPNPIPRVKHPDWLHKKLVEKNDVFKQKRITDMFTVPKKKRKFDEEQTPEINDIESFEASSTSNFCFKVTNAKRHKPDEYCQDEMIGSKWQDELGIPPPLCELFQGTYDSRTSWIKFHKKKWSIQRKNKTNKTSQSVTRTKFSTATGIGGFLKQQSSNIFTLPWEVIQVTETNEPGQFKVFALIESEMHILKVNVPRIFYVNQKTAKVPSTDNNLPWKKVNRILPRGAQVANLYEYRIPEVEYLKKWGKIRTELLSPDVLAVYELQVSLMLRVITELGCVWKVSRMARMKAASLDLNLFNINELECQSLKNIPYLQKRKLKEIYIYHHCTSKKHIVGVFISATKKCMVYVVDTVRENRMPNLQTLFRLEKEKCEENNFLSSDYAFEIRVETELNQMYKNLQRLLTTYKNEHRGPSIIALQSNFQIAFFADVSIANEFPIIQIFSRPSTDFVDELSWQKDAAKEMMQRFFEVNAYLFQLTDKARHFSIPIGNLPRNSEMLGDISFARHLLKHNHLLWCSKSHRPDLGGHEVDDNRFGMENNDNQPIIINNSGFYQSVCIEMDLSSLAINTLVQSHHVNNMEGAGIGLDVVQQSTLQDFVNEKNNTIGGLANYSDTTLCLNTLRILKSMVQSWLRDVSLHQNSLADYQLQNFYNWLSNPKSLFYDPVLFQTLYAMMKKIFLQLIAELKKMGSNIVFANFSKIILSTKKKNVEDAISYAEYVNMSIISKDVFHSIVLSVAQCWIHLLWLDQTNFGGIKFKELNKDNDGENLSEETKQTDKGVVEMHFNMCRYLPTKCRIQETFEMVIAGYISIIFNEFVLEHEGLSQGIPVKRHVSSQANTLITGLNKEDREKLIVSGDANVSTKLVVFAQDLISGDLTQQMFRASQKITKSLPSDASALINLFPKLPGSHLQNLNHPVLEFVKCVCKVLMVDNQVVAQVEKMRLSLLRLIGVGEFSNCAEWIDPCSSYIMGQVLCANCNSSRDLDLCRDAIYIPDNNKCIWICSGCTSPYDSDYIEHRIISNVQQKVMAYNFQDLFCTKCKEVKQVNMSRQCECAGNFGRNFNSSELEKHLRILKNIAKLATLKNLQHFLDWVFRTL